MENVQPVRNVPPATKTKTQQPDENKIHADSPGRRPESGPAAMSASRLSLTPLGRVQLNAICLCRRPAAAGFYVRGLARELREWRHHRVPR